MLLCVKTVVKRCSSVLRVASTFQIDKPFIDVNVIS